MRPPTVSGPRLSPSTICSATWRAWSDSAVAPHLQVTPYTVGIFVPAVGVDDSADTFDEVGHGVILSSSGRNQSRPERVTVFATFSTFLASLRMPNPEMISMIPRMISQMPTTRPSVTMESNG
jgi:hypothetical protein